MNTRILLIITLIAAVALPFTGFVLEGLWWGIAGTILSGGLWYLGMRYQRSQFVHLAFAALLGFDTFIMLVQPLVFGLVGGFAALAAWDLNRFYPRLKAFSPPEASRTAEKRHLVRLGVVLGSGLALAGLIQLLQFEFNFVTSFFLSLLALIGVRLIAATLFKPPSLPGEEK